jgi:transposase
MVGVMAAEPFAGTTREDLIAMISALAEENEALRAQMRDLAQRVRQLEQRKSPPSTPSSQKSVWDKPAPKPDPKPPGRKKGHMGVTRPRPERIDQTIDHTACTCPECGTALEKVDQREHIVEEIIPAVVEAHRHVWRRGRCPRCKKVRDLRPPQVRPGAYLGTETMLLAAWLKTHLGQPYRKVAELLETIAGLRVSPGGLSQGLKSLARDFQTEVDAIERALRQAPAIHADETGLRVAGRSHWLWAFVSERLARYRAEPTRAGRVAAQVLGEDFGGTLLCDFYPAYNQIDCKKQRCLAHLLREVESALDGLRGPGRPPPFLLEAAQWCDDALAADQRWHMWTPSTRAKWRRRVVSRFERLLTMRTSNADSQRLQARLWRHHDEMLTFLGNPDVEATNNRAERAIRPAVITRKISGGHRSEAGARAVADVTSVLRTCALQTRGFIETGLEILGHRHLGLPHTVLA